MRKPLLLLIFLLAPFTIQPDEIYVVKMGTLAPEGSAWIDVWKKVVRDLEKESKGRIKMITYAGGVMGDEPEMVKKMRMGQLNMGGFTINGIKHIAPELLVLELPFLLRSWQEADYIKEKFFQRFSAYFEEKGFILLAIVDQGFIRFYSRYELKSFEDLKKRKVWVWQGEPVMTATTTELFGVNPIYTTVPEVLPSLQTGLIDTIQTSPLACVALQWCHLIKYLFDFDIRYEPAVIVMSKNTFDSTPDDLKEIHMKFTKKYVPDFLKLTRQEQENSLKQLKKRGVIFVKPSDAEISELEKKAKEFWDETVKTGLFPKDLVKDIVSALEEYRKGKGK